MSPSLQDMLQLMLDAQQKIKSGRIMTEDEISASCGAFVAAGYETTSTALSTLIYELAMQPDYQEMLYKEVNIPSFSFSTKIICVLH